MLFLQRNDFLKIIEAERGRLAAVPGDIDHRPRRGFDLLDDVALEHLVAHPEGVAFGIEKFFFEVIAVAAIEVADRPDRLRHYLKFAQRRRHGTLPASYTTKGPLERQELPCY